MTDRGQHEFKDFKEWTCNVGDVTEAEGDLKTLCHLINAPIKKLLGWSLRCVFDRKSMLGKIALPVDSGWERSAWGISHFPIHSHCKVESITAYIYIQ